MNPLSLHANGYRTFAELDLTLPEGCLAVIGSNGAGKSSLVNAVDLALFAGRGELAQHASLQGDKLALELRFEHGGHEYLVCRNYQRSGGGRTSLDLQQRNGTGWQPLTRETQAETQAEIERILGFDRRTFRASSFLGQGDGAAFTQAAPAERKAILAAMLGLDVYDRLCELARRDRRSAEDALERISGRIALQDEALERREVVEMRVEAAQTAAEDAEDVVRRATESHQEAREAAGATRSRLEESERARTALKVAEAELTPLAAIAVRGEHAKDEALDVEDKLGLLGQKATAAEVEETVRRLERDRDVYAHLLAARDQLIRRRDALEHDAARIRGYADERRRAADALAVGTDRCGRCGQLLGMEAFTRARASYHDEALDFEAQASRMDEEAATIVIPEEPEQPDTAALAAARKALDESREAQLEIARLRQQLASLRLDIQTADAQAPARLEATAAVRDARARLAALGTPPTTTEQHTAYLAETEAEHSLGAARGRLEEARIRQAEAARDLERLDEIADQRAADVAERDRQQDAKHLAGLLERAFGRDGIPAMLVDAFAIPQIETEANRILTELGAPMRVQLHTLRQAKSKEGLLDTLDIIVSTDDGQRPYETFSGGEQTRLNLALRLALATLLASRRGADSQLLVIDEPDWLDETGVQALVSLLRGLEPRFARIVLVSHVPILQDAFEQTLVVSRKDHGWSKVEAR